MHKKPAAPGDSSARQDEKSAQFWDQVGRSDQWGGLHGILDADRRLAAYRDHAEKRLLFPRLRTYQKRWERAIEIGCGGGRWTVELARHYRLVLATDIAPSMIERLKAGLAEADIRNVETRVESMTQFAVQGPKADLIYLGSCLQYIDDAGIREGMERLSEAADGQSVLLSRDTVSTLGRTFHRHERYSTGDPTIYRTAGAYRDLLAPYGWNLATSWPSYAKPLSWAYIPTPG